MIPLKTKQAVLEESGELTIGDTVVEDKHSVHEENDVVEHEQELNTMNQSPLKRKPGSVETFEDTKLYASRSMRDI